MSRYGRVCREPRGAHWGASNVPALRPERPLRRWILSYSPFRRCGAGDQQLTRTRMGPRGFRQDGALRQPFGLLLQQPCACMVAGGERFAGMVGVHDHPWRVVLLGAGGATARGDASEGCHWRRATDHVVGLFRCGELSACSVLVHGGAVPHLLDVLQCTTGAELHPQLRVEPQDIVLATGHNPHADSCTSMSAPTFAWRLCCLWLPLYSGR